jgi:CHAT domain-containing protein/tetratricopeptide (TPR) repeat protein
MAMTARRADPAPLLSELGRLSNRRDVSRFFRQHSDLCDAALVERLHDEVVQLTLADVGRADRLARAATHLAELLADDGARAQSLRAVGHVLFARGRWGEALDRYLQALELFRRVDQELNVARTLSGALQTLIYLGQYDRAFAAAEEARAIFDRHGDRLRLARLDSNLGNILYRQERFEEALVRYHEAYQQLREIGEPRDVAAVLSNTAVCYISLNDFTSALETYQRARSFCQEHQMPLLVLQADYNVAYLHFLRGEYAKALDMYRAVQTQCEASNDRYHLALCDLDRSELYLELNLSEEGGRLAESARVAFEELGMRYEAAKALMNVGLAAGQRGEAAAALGVFDRARLLFGVEGNPVCQALVDLYRAIVLHRGGHDTEAAKWCRRASVVFQRSGMPVKVALCELLLARLAIERGRTATATRLATSALDRLERAGAPALAFQAHYVLGLAAEANHDTDAALQAFERAHESVEQLRSHLQGEDAKVAFLNDKLAVYEALVSLCLERDDVVAAYGYIEEAKSRSLADLMACRAAWLAPRAPRPEAEDIARVRRELNCHYHQMSAEALRHDRGSAARVERLRRRASGLESKLVESLRAIGQTDQEFAALQTGGACRIDQIQASLPAASTLVEYYEARGRMYAAVLDRQRLDIVALAPATRIRSLVRMLQFHLSKFRFGSTYTTAFAGELRTVTEAHLFELYSELIAPLRSRLSGNHLVVVPHGFLHCVPFHALTDGERFVIDDFTMSYAPSASVYRLCAAKPPVEHQGSLVMGVPHASLPHVRTEVQAVAEALPSPVVLMGKQATHERLRTLGARSRFIHIATHGHVRRDNPMFSSIDLGTGPLSLFDLYQLDLSAELVTLSGCSTGVNVVTGGDEVVGLVRGLLYSGARAVLLTLWDAYDRSTAAFMTAFYRSLAESRTKSAALRFAMREVRAEFPHPFYWAPFVLVGPDHVPASPEGDSVDASAAVRRTLPFRPRIFPRSGRTP